MTPGTVNWARYQPDSSGGFYESFFLRANHPTRPLAFWIRYTLFSPRGRPGDTIGELWAIYFDGEKQAHVAVKREVPFVRCSFDRARFAVQVDDAALEPGRLTGAAEAGSHRIAWNLAYDGNQSPLFLLPDRAYSAALPKAKSLVGLPFATFIGSLRIDDEPIDVTGWIGSQNHNWGTRHTDWYAWGQVAGFDDFPRSFLEVATARVKLGPLWAPTVTLVVLRHEGEELQLNSIRQGLRTSAEVGYFTWTFRAENERVRIDGHLEGAAEAFVALRYLNPPGGTKFCLNSKIAACDLRVTWRDTTAERTTVLRTASRAAFEILTDDASHGLIPRV